MAGERTYAILPCADMDDSLQFYGALGFEVTYRQKRPNPYAVVAREEIQIHLAGIDRFDPSQSYGSVIIAVPDVDTLYSDIADRLRGTVAIRPRS